MKKIFHRASEFFAKRQKINIQDLALFTHHFAVMYKSGIGIVKIFDILSQQTNNRKLKYVLEKVKHRVLSDGDTLNGAFSKFPEIFPPVYISLIKTGEVSGGRSFVLLLDRLTDNLEKEYMLREKIRAALIYPVMVFAMSILILIIGSIFIFPVFVPLLEAEGIEKPLPTIMLVSFIKAGRNPWIVFMFLTVTILVVLLFARIMRSTRGREFFEKILLRAPVMSKILVKINSVLFCRTLSVLYKNGVNILEALAITRGVMTLEIYRKYIDGLIKNMREEGVGMYEYFYSHHLFPRDMVQIIAVGESTGDLGSVLEKMAKLYDEELDFFLLTTVNLLEPFLMLFMGCGVLFLLLAVFIPLYKMLEF